MEFRYLLEKGSKKYLCPKCGMKTFVPYIDNSDKSLLNKVVGRCDREINCAYHYSPSQFFKDKTINNKRPGIKPPDTKKIGPVPKCSSFITWNEVLKTTGRPSYYKTNNFVQFLLSIFPYDIVKSVCLRFFIGTYEKWSGATIFWQIDEKNNVRSGKVIHYNGKTGKRAKSISWMHRILKLENFELCQCLFGLHQINEYPNKIIGIVESEKTAIIMTCLGLSEGIMENYIWMATGSLSMLKTENLVCLQNKKIVLFPDLGIDKTGKGTPYQQWSTKIREIHAIGCKITTSDLLEKRANLIQKKEGYDIADFVIENLKEKYCDLNWLKVKNPAIIRLINNFNLKLEESTNKCLPS